MVHLEPPAASDWDFARSMAGLALLADIGVEHGVALDVMLRGTGLDAADLRDHESEASAAQELRVIRNLVAVAPSVSGAAVGERYHLTTFGIFGFALMSSRTVLDAMNIALRFIDLSHTFSIPEVSVTDGEVVVELDTARLPGDLRQFLLERDLVAITRVLGELRPGGVPVAWVQLQFPEPASTAPYVAALGLVPTFAAPRNAFAFDERLLGEPLPQANPQAVAMAEDICRDMVTRRRRTGITQQVRVQVAQQLSGGAPMELVAAGLGLSTRTLRRRLAAEGASYQSVLDEVRQSLAERMLATGRLTVEDVAQRLGYAEASSFIHAFKRWRGTTPAAYVRELR
jgi:AraC-like DNA-binding protein